MNLEIVFNLCSNKIQGLLGSDHIVKSIHHIGIMQQMGFKYRIRSDIIRLDLIMALCLCC